ncbi:class II aldolase/adducin family protein, partial [Bordetella hinzii]|nr:class II aldolase/adducin family protein [Bordetella hinzii]
MTPRPGVLNLPSMKERCTAQEWEARVNLAACYRLIDLYGMSDMMANH